MATKLGIPVTRYCTDSYQSDETYGEWWETFDVTVGELAIIEPSENTYDYQYEGYEGVVEDGDTLWVIVAVYSSGDSFGSTNGGCVDVISINKDVEVAQRNLKAATAAPDGEFAVIELDDGTTHQYYRPWSGYFESLDSLQIYEMIATKENTDE